MVLAWPGLRSLAFQAHIKTIQREQEEKAVDAAAAAARPPMQAILREQTHSLSLPPSFLLSEKSLLLAIYR